MLGIFKLKKIRKSISGFSLLEVMIGVAVFALFAVGIYSGIQLVFKIVYNSRIKILESGILNEQIEIIRNMPFEQIGIVNGSPAGVLERTVTTTRNNINFTVTRSIRNIDDPYDGVIGGTPNDTAPADYKLVQVEIICVSCNQQTPAFLSTLVAPKNLEGNLNHGALFIQVFDANAVPVQGAIVHLVSTSTNPTIDLTDTTDNEGMLRIVDLPPGIGVYQISVNKTGYTTDQTMISTVSNPHPTKPGVSVVAQDITNISFSIDKVSGLQVYSINKSCQVVGNVGFNFLGTKMIGLEPDVFLVDQSITTNGSGYYSLPNLVWDNYGFRPSGYDLIGVIPSVPIVLPPDVEQPVQLILGSATANSLLVQVRDSITGQPLSSSTIRLSATGYDQTKATGVGFVNQTNWSGGSGQLDYIDETKYAADDGKVEINSLAGDLKLKKVGQNYVSSGWLESSIFDLGVEANFVNVIFNPASQPEEVGADSLRLQMATSNTSTPTNWDYFGPDGTVSTYYDPANIVIDDINNNNRYFRYKVYLNTLSATNTPTLSDVSFTYVTSCTPPGQAYFGGLVNQVYNLEVSHPGYQTSTQAVTISDDMIVGVDLSAS